MRVLTEAEVQEQLPNLPGWQLIGGALVRGFTFPDFTAAMHFVNAIAALAEQADHHPDIDIRYNRVRLSLLSHDAGGITNRDISMTKRINQKFPAESDT